MNTHENLVTRLRGAVDLPHLEARAIANFASTEEEMDWLITQRLSGRPLAYVLGQKEFYSLNFLVSPSVLIPRPDSETLVDVALDIARSQNIASVLDLGCGSGCLLMSILSNLPTSAGVGVDVSELAIGIARRNAVQLGLENKVTLLAQDWNSLGHLGTFDLIVSNPPYIATKELCDLDASVRDFEPHLALDGGVDGLNCYRELMLCVPGLLSGGGWFVVECGAGQARDVSELMKMAGLKVERVVQDLAGIERVVAASKSLS